MNRLFHNRRDAGRQLATYLRALTQGEDLTAQNAIVLGLPRGGIPVAYEVAEVLHLPLDVCLVRKLGVPGRPEIAMGAIAPGGVRILNDEIVYAFAISESAIEHTAAREAEELARRNQAYRGDRPPLELAHRTVILVDDGIATGATIRAAISLVRQQHPRAIILAVPVAPPSVCQVLRNQVEQLVCLSTPSPFNSVSLWYEHFPQTTDEAVRERLAKALANVSASPSVSPTSASAIKDTINADGNS